MQEWIVGACVAWAAGVIFGRYLPPALRAWFAVFAARTLTRLGLVRMALHVMPVHDAASRGCGSCSNCRPGSSPTRQSVTPVVLHRAIRKSSIDR